MAHVAVRHITKYFDRYRALDDVTIDFANGGLYSLLGPSGSGKTTLLRIVAGFEFPTEGSVQIGGKAVEDVPVDKRDVGMMFQNYALFPNMSVYDNVAFGLTVRGVASREIKQAVEQTLALVQLSELEKRKPHQLSGGQKQRVALARAIIIKPRVLLLDEPLSALDKALRMEMQVELKRIQREIGITTIFVTHDQEEALTLSDRVGILRDGALVQEGAPLDIYERPNSVFTATFLGDANIFRGRRVDDTLVLEDGTALICASRSNAPKSNPQDVAIAVRPEKMFIQRVGARTAIGDKESGVNRVNGVVAQQLFSGTSMTYLVDACGQTIKVFIQNRGDEALNVGDAVTIFWAPEHSIEVAP